MNTQHVVVICISPCFQTQFMTSIDIAITLLALFPSRQRNNWFVIILKVYHQNFLKEWLLLKSDRINAPFYLCYYWPLSTVFKEDLHEIVEVTIIDIILLSNIIPFCTGLDWRINVSNTYILAVSYKTFKSLKRIVQDIT